MTAIDSDILDKPAEADSRRARILEGAMGVFLAYGFQRTTMDDIARAAEISRPALYLQFRNKQDIYRALASDFLDEALARAQGHLEGGGCIVEQLDRTFDATFEMMEEIEKQPHGSDLVDMKNRLAGDLVADCRLRIRTLLAGALAREAGRTGADLSARGYSPMGLADLLLDALDGLKMRGLSLSDQKLARRQYVRVVARLLDI